MDTYNKLNRQVKLTGQTNIHQLKIWFKASRQKLLQSTHVFSVSLCPFIMSPSQKNMLFSCVHLLSG